MIFTELVLQNFGPYAGRHVIDLRPEIANNSRPIVLFGGMNGGGKTTLMDAIRLTLYGQRAQCSTRSNLSYGDFLTQSVNNQTSPSEQTRIELAFEHLRDGQWVELRIVRSWTRNPKDGKDSLGILEGDWPDTALANTWDEYIEKLLPLGISNLFLFDGEQVKELAEQEMPPPAVVEAIQSLLGLELAEQLAVDLDILASRKRKSLATQSQRKNLEEIEAKLEKYRREAEIARETLASLQNQLYRAQSKHQEAADRFRLEGGRIAAEKSQLERKVRELTQTAENLRQEMRDWAAGVLPLGLLLPLLQNARQQAGIEIRVEREKVSLDLLKKHDSRLLDYLFHLSLLPEQLAKIEDFLEGEKHSLLADIEQHGPPWLGLDEEVLKHLETVIEHQLPQQIQGAARQIEALKEIELQVEARERELAVAASPEAYEKLDEALQIAQQEWVDCKAAYEAENRHYEEIERGIEKTKKELEQYSEKALSQQNDEHVLHSIAKVQKTLQQFRDRLTLKKLNKLEGEVSECFRYLLHKSDLVHRVAIDTHQFSLSLYDPEGRPVPKHRLSAGEKQLLAIALLWGLARVSGKNLPVAIDTPLGRLDSSHRSNLVERYFPAASQQVILLSTDSEIGEREVRQLRERGAIAREYLLRYDPSLRQTAVQPGYFC